MTLHLMTAETATAADLDTAWNLMTHVVGLTGRIGRDVITDVEIDAAGPTVRLYLDAESTDAWGIGPGLALFGRGLCLEAGSGDLYRVAFGTYTFGGFPLELHTLADPDEDGPALPADAIPGHLQTL